jgi:hypothetical protein
MYCNNNFGGKYCKMLGQGEVGSGQQGYSLYIVCHVHITKWMYDIQYVLPATIFVNKGVTPSKPD